MAGFIDILASICYCFSSFLNVLGVSLMAVAYLFLVFISVISVAGSTHYYRRNVQVFKLIREAIEVGNQIEIWIKNNVKDGYPIAVLNDPELVSIFVQKRSRIIR